MKILTVNMYQFRDKFQVNSDNEAIHERITTYNGKFLTLYPEIYTNVLNQFGINYSLF